VRLFPYSLTRWDTTVRCYYANRFGVPPDEASKKLALMTEVTKSSAIPLRLPLERNPCETGVRRLRKE
jgi:hypothetical protein